MNYLLMLLVGWLGSQLKSTPSPFVDIPLITENSVGKAQLGMSFRALRKAYQGCTFTPIYLASYGFDEYPAKPDAVLVSQNRQKLFLYCDTYNVVGNKQIYTRKIAILLALHPAYQTRLGIHVGASSGALRAVLPTIKIGPNTIANRDIQVASVEKSHISYEFLNQKDLGPQRKEHYGEDVPLTVKTGRISWIQVRGE